MGTATTRIRRPLALAIGLALSAGADAYTITVTDGGDTDPTISTTCTLRQAINTANNPSIGDIGNCYRGGGATSTIEFVAGLANKEISLSHGELDVVGSTVTLSGSGQVINAGGSSRVFYVFAGSLTASYIIIDKGSVTDADGGGIKLSGSLPSLSLSHVTMQSNSTVSGRGGAIFAGSGASVVCDDCTLIDNTATAGGRGGAIYALAHTLTLTNSTVSGNSASNGAGINSLAINTRISDSTISGNTSDFEGGAMHIAFGTLTLSDSTVSGNQGRSGGGVFTLGSSIVANINGSTFENNHASTTGGAMSFSSSNSYAGPTVTLTDTTVSGNTASANGAGMFASNAVVKVGNSTFYDNSAAGNGGGIFNYVGSTVTLSNATIAGNTANSGGGIYALFGTLTLNNSIFSANTATTYGTSSCYINTPSATLNASHNLVSDYANGCKDIADGVNGNHTNTDAILVALLSNGGATKTMALDKNSPALGAGDPTLVDANSTLVLSYDQRGIGYPRTYGGQIDIGAWQHQPKSGDRIFAGLFEAEP